MYKNNGLFMLHVELFSSLFNRSMIYISGETKGHLFTTEGKRHPKPHQSNRFYISEDVVTRAICKHTGKTPEFSTLPFSVILIRLEQLMDQEFSCPCTAGHNMILISFIFLGPALLALTVMML